MNIMARHLSFKSLFRAFFQYGTAIERTLLNHERNRYLSFLSAVCLVAARRGFSPHYWQGSSSRAFYKHVVDRLNDHCNYNAALFALSFKQKMLRKRDIELEELLCLTWTRTGDFHKIITLVSSYQSPPISLLRYLAVAYHELGQQGKLSELREMFKLDIPKANRDMPLLRFSIESLSGYSLEAFGLGADLLSRFPDDEEVLFEVCSYYFRCGSLKKVRDVLRTVSDNDKSDRVRYLEDLVAGEISVLLEGRRPSIESPAPLYHERDHRKLEVLHVLEMSLPERKSGYSYRSHAILSNMKDRKHVAASTRPGFGRYERPEGITLHEGISYHRLPLNGSQEYAHHSLVDYLDHYTTCLDTLVKRVSPSVLHAASNFKNAIAALAVSQKRAIPCVYELRGLWEDTLVASDVLCVHGERYLGYRATEDWCLSQADAVVVLSETLREDVINRGIRAEKIFVVPNGVETSNVMPSSEKDPELESTFSLDDSKVIGYIGSISEYEGLDLLLAAFAKLEQDSSCSLRCLIVGDGPGLSRLKEVANELGIADKVIFTGRVLQSDIARYYSLLDLFVLPRKSHRVTQLVTPLKPLEPMLMCIPLVVSDLPALVEVTHSYASYFRAESVESLVETCRAHLSNTIKVKSHMQIECARNWVLEERDWSQLVTRYDEVYEYACQQKHGSRSGNTRAKDNISVPKAQAALS